MNVNVRYESPCSQTGFHVFLLVLWPVTDGTVLLILLLLLFDIQNAATVEATGQAFTKFTGKVNKQSEWDGNLHQTSTSLIMTECSHFDWHELQLQMHRAKEGLTSRLGARLSGSRATVTMQVSSSRGQTRVFGGIGHLENMTKIFEMRFMVTLHYVTVLLCADLTSPCMRLASPSAAEGNPGGSPKPADDSRLCISLMPGPLCPLAWRWRTLMASSRWSSILPAYRQQIEWMIQEFCMYL